MFFILGKGINVYISLACENGHVAGGCSRNNDFPHSNRQNLESFSGANSIGDWFFKINNQAFGILNFVPVVTKNIKKVNNEKARLIINKLLKTRLALLFCSKQ